MSRRLHLRLPAGRVRAVALLLHGGSTDSYRPSPPLAPAALPMAWLAHRLQRSAAGDGLAVALLRYQVRGWNGAAASPVADALWAMADLDRRLGRLPLALVGHSMGGRAVVRVGGEPAVRAVVALAPWLPPGEPAEQLAGRRLAVVHGTLDRTTDPRASEAFAARAARAGADVAVVLLRRTGHTTVRRARLWHRLAEEAVRAGLDLPPAPGPPALPSGSRARHGFVGSHLL